MKADLGAAICTAESLAGYDEYSYTFRRHSIVLTLEPGRNWYIRVTAPSGLRSYDGYWLNSVGRSLKDALQEAKEGAMLVKPPKTDSPPSESSPTK